MGIGKNSRLHTKLSGLINEFKKVKNITLVYTSVAFTPTMNIRKEYLKSPMWKASLKTA